MVRFLAWFAIVLLALWCVFIGGAWWGLYVTQLRVVSAVLVGGVFMVWFVLVARREAWRPRSSLMPAIIAALGSLALSTITSLDPRISLEYLAYAVVLAGLYLLLVRLMASDFFRPRLGSFALTVAAASGVLFLAKVLVNWTAWWGLVGQLTVPPLRPLFESLVWGNPSSVLAIIVMFAVPGAAVVGLQSRARIAVIVGLLVLVAVVAVTSGSRAGWIAIALTLGVVGAMALLRREGRMAIVAGLRTAWSSATWRVVTIAGFAVGAGGVAVLGPAILRRALEGGEDLRFAFLTAAARMFREAPVTGVGPGMWVVLRTTHTVPPETDYYIPHAHNLYAQTLAELGVAGAVAGLLLIGLLARLVFRSMRDPDALRRRMAWATLAVLVYFGSHQLLDLFANMPSMLLAAALPVAWLDATSPLPDQTGRPSTWFKPTLLTVSAVAVGLSVGGLLVIEGPALSHDRAVALANEGEWDAALAPALEAVRADPEMTPYQFTAGLALSRSGDHAAAAAAFRVVAERDGYPEAWLNLAAESFALGRTREASAAIEEALRLGLQRPAISMAAGDLALRLGDTETATRAFGAGVAVLPALAGDPWWASEPSRAGLAPRVVELAILQASRDAAWEVALMAGDPARALGLAATAGDPGFAGDVIGAWIGEPGARTSIFARCEARPLELPPLGWCGRLAGRSGDIPTAERYRAWAEYIIGGAGASGAIPRVANTDIIGRRLAGSPAIFWGYYTYRRPTPWNPLVPDLVHLVLT